MTDETEATDGQEAAMTDEQESIGVGVGVGDRVTVASDGPVIDGIVFELPSRTKAVVAVIDRKRGPVLRSVAVDALAARADERPADRALRLLIRRTPGGGRPGGSARAGGARGSAGFARPTAHRPTGR